MQKQFFKGLVTKSETEGRYRVLASTAAVDRMGDVVDQAGWDLTNFKLNPVMPWAHDYSELPIAKVISIEVTERGLEAEFEFASAEGNPKAQQVKNLYDNGFLNAVSVGFIPKERQGNRITKSELLEISFVPVPANQEALKLAMKDLDLSLIPEVSEAMEKGEVADQLAEVDMWEKKWENWEGVQEVMSALWSAYFDVNTPVEDFNKLLAEAADLLKKVANMEADEEAKAMILKYKTPESLKGFVDVMALKSGRTLSKKTLDKMTEAINSMKDATSVMEELTATSSDDVQDGKVEETPAEEAEVTEEDEQKGLILSFEDMQIIRRTLINSSKTNEVSLSIVNTFLKQKGIS